MKKTSLFVISILFLLGIWWWFPTHTPKKSLSPITFATKESINNYIQIKATPIHSQTEQKMWVTLSITSYQNTSIFEDPIDKISLLVINNTTPLKPLHFIPEKKTEHETSGRLTFDVSSNIQSFSLHIFEEIEHVITWNIQ